MKKIVYICDNCGEEKEYWMNLNDTEPRHLARVLNKDYCRKCLKEIFKIN